ncbi:MAG: hypothetical protein NTZ33_14320 [Bacteroidetes bacterium]|nr:hypothetical protein [Bacteroidota bacterium]
MKKIDIKKSLKLCKTLWKIGLYFLFSETVFFLFKYGPHFRATTLDEKICDYIALIFFVIAIAYFIKVALYVIELHIDKKK